MKFLHSLCAILLAFGLLQNAYSQKGLPPVEKTSASVKTNFPKHLDFSDSMLNRLVVPKGFKIEVAASGLGKPRMLAVSEKGSLYITRRDQGDVLLLNDSNGDGVFDQLKVVLTQFKGVHGITIHDGYVYLCANKELKRAKILSDEDLGAAELLINDLPDGGQHGNRTIAFGPDGMLYITVGSSCNDCNETNKEHATILKSKPNGSERMIYARGLRNTIGFDWHPETGELWGADNGTDWRGDDFPPEEINKIIEGEHYGWPLVFGKQQVDETREDPTGTTKKAFAMTTQPSVLELPAHSAPINFVFLNKAVGFPTEYKDDALVSLHGSWNKQNPDGYKVQRVKFENGRPVSSEDFLSGFLSKDGSSRFGRPAGITVSPKGFIYISDDANGVIYKVSSSDPTVKQNKN